MLQIGLESVVEIRCLRDKSKGCDRYRHGSKGVFNTDQRAHHCHVRRLGTVRGRSRSVWGKRARQKGFLTRGRRLRPLPPLRVDLSLIEIRPPRMTGGGGEGGEGKGEIR